MKHDKTPRGSMPAGHVVASGPTRSPWLRILAVSAAAAGAAVLLAALAALLVSGPAGALSCLLSAVLVMVFFGISLLLGHFMGRRNPSGALGMFAVTYVIKVVGFGVILWFVGTPDWLSRTWFFVGAVVAVLVWQGAEVIAFSRTRQQIFNDPSDPSEADRA